MSTECAQRIIESFTMAAICLLPFRFPSEFIFDSDSAALICTPVPLCMYMCTLFQVLVLDLAMKVDLLLIPTDLIFVCEHKIGNNF